MAAAIGLGASLSNVISGYIVKTNGFNFGFYVLSAIATVAFIVFWTMMPETVSCADDKPGNNELKKLHY